MSKYQEEVKEMRDRSKFPPSVYLTNAPGLTLECRVKGKNVIGEGRQRRVFYEVEIISTTAPIGDRDPEGKIVERTVAPGDVVSLYAQTRLERKLDAVTDGIPVLITYLGEEPTGQGGVAKNFSVKK